MRLTQKTFLLLALLSFSSVVVQFAFSAQNQLTNNSTLISLEARDADVKDVLRALAKQSGANIIISEDVEGSVTVSFDNISIQDALDIILRANNLAFVERNNVVWIDQQENLAKSGEGMITKIIKLNYANSTEMVSQVKGVLKPMGTVIADSRTNSLIIKDLPAGIQEAESLLKALDTKTLQVVIEARIVEVSSNFSKELGVRWGGKIDIGESTLTGVSALSTTSNGSNFAVSLPAADITGGIGFTIGSIGDSLLLDMELTAGERDGRLRIVSRPKITTTNNKPATIHSGLTFRIRTAASTTTTEGSEFTSATLEEIKTGINLTVTPQISSNNSVLLKIEADKSDPDFSRAIDGIPGVIEKSASTTVLVKDGETTVIGGLYRSTSSSQDDKVPYLSKIPLLGWLFKSHEEKIDNEELLIFITPHIIRE